MSHWFRFLSAAPVALALVLPGCAYAQLSYAGIWWDAFAREGDTSPHSNFEQVYVPPPVAPYTGDLDVSWEGSRAIATLEATTDTIKLDYSVSIAGVEKTRYARFRVEAAFNVSEEVVCTVSHLGTFSGNAGTHALVLTYPSGQIEEIDRFGYYADATPAPRTVALRPIEFDPLTPPYGMYTLNIEARANSVPIPATPSASSGELTMDCDPPSPVPSLPAFIGPCIVGMSLALTAYIVLRQRTGSRP